MPDPSPPAAGPGTWSLLRRFVALVGAPLELVSFLGLTIVGSVSEAGVILLVVAGASGLVEGSDTVAVDWGPLDGTLPIDAVLWLSLAGVVVLVSAKLGGGALASRLSAGVLRHGRNRLVRSLLGTTWTHQASLTLARFQDLLSVQALRLGNLVAVLGGAVTGLVAFLAMVAAALLVEPITAIALLLVGAVIGLVFRPLTERVRRLSFGHVERHHDYVEHAANLFGVLPEIRVYDVREAAEDWHETVSGGVAHEYRRMRFAATIQPALYLGIVMLMLIVGLAVVRAQAQTDLALIGAIVLVLLRGLRYSQQAQARWQHAVELLPYLSDFERMIRDWDGAGRQWGTRTLERAEVLQLRDVHYTYPDGSRGLRGVDVTLEPGAIVGLAGPSGSGKSTLAQVLLGLREPTAGTYLVDGVPTQEFAEESWFSRFAYVAQDPVLLDDDVRENVRFLRDHLDDDAVAAALSDAAMDADLAAWPAGASRRVGSGGSEVSGGQRQRIAIARALVGSPDVLVLDEPTSALDPGAEQVIRETLDRLRGRLTVVLIAHRESTLEVCDVVVALADGRVASVEAGGGPGPSAAPVGDRHSAG